MKVTELAATHLLVEFSEQELEELAAECGVMLPGRVWRIPGCLSGDFCALACEMKVAAGEGAAFTSDALDDAQRLAVAETVCWQWPFVSSDCDIRFVGSDGELWCCGDRSFAITVRSLRSSAVLWTLLALMVVAAEVALSFVLAALEGVFGVLLINLFLAPFSAFCLLRSLYAWRFRVVANLQGVSVRPTAGRERAFTFPEITKVERTAGTGYAGEVRKLVIRTANKRVAVRESQEGIEALDAFLHDRILSDRVINVR